MDGLRAVPVVIAGEWKPVSFVGRLLWEGTATADEPITAVALARDSAGTTTWCRAGRGQTGIMNFQLRVESDQSSDSRSAARVALGIWPYGQSSGNGTALLQMRANLTSDAPFFLSLDHAATGTEFWIAKVRETGGLKPGALFVCEADTRSTRNHLWHLRRGKAAQNDRLTDAFGYGRKGLFSPHGS